MACADILPPTGANEAMGDKSDGASRASAVTPTELAQTNAIQSRPNAAQGGRQWIGWYKAATTVAVLVTTGIAGVLNGL